MTKEFLKLKMMYMQKKNIYIIKLHLNIYVMRQCSRDCKSWDFEHLNEVLSQTNYMDDLINVFMDNWEKSRSKKKLGYVRPK
jgi:hypothetical protein